MDFELKAASGDDFRIVSNLTRFYYYDMAEHAGFDFSAEGDFNPDHRLANYWGKPGARDAWPSEWRGFPFLLRVEGKPAGFALVKRLRQEPPVFDMGEFFVGRQYRRRGIGRHIAGELFDRFQGRWEVREMITNKGAQAFWRSIIGDYTGGTFTDAREVFPDYNNQEFVVQRFQSHHA